MHSGHLVIETVSNLFHLPLAVGGFVGEILDFLLTILKGGTESARTRNHLAEVRLRGVQLIRKTGELALNRGEHAALTSENRFVRFVRLHYALDIIWILTS